MRLPAARSAKGAEYRTGNQEVAESNSAAHRLFFSTFHFTGARQDRLLFLVCPLSLSFFAVKLAI